MCSPKRCLFHCFTVFQSQYILLSQNILKERCELIFSQILMLKTDSYKLRTKWAVQRNTAKMLMCASRFWCLGSLTHTLKVSFIMTLVLGAFASCICFILFSFFPEVCNPFTVCQSLVHISQPSAYTRLSLSVCPFSTGHYGTLTTKPRAVQECAAGACS